MFSNKKVDGRVQPLVLQNYLDKIIKWAKNHEIVVGYKVDGLTVKLVYLDGILIQGSTRGDGEKGDDITEQARFLKDVPHEIPEKNYNRYREMYCQQPPP